MANNVKNANNKVFTSEDLFNEVISTLKAKGVKDSDLPTQESFNKKLSTSTQVGSMPINTEITLTGEISIEVTGTNAWYGMHTTNGDIISLKNILPLRLGDVMFSGSYSDVCWKTKNTPIDSEGNKLEETPITIEIKAEKAGDWQETTYTPVTDVTGKLIVEINPQQLYIAIRNGKYNLKNLKICLKARGVRVSKARRSYQFGHNYVRVGDSRVTSIATWQNVDA